MRENIASQMMTCIGFWVGMCMVLSNYDIPLKNCSLIILGLPWFGRTAKLGMKSLKKGCKFDFSNLLHY
jgi:hypothetical protein